MVKPVTDAPLLSHWWIYPFCLIHISTPALTTLLSSHWPIRMGHFLKTQRPLTNKRTGFASFTYYASLPNTAHPNTIKRLPPILLICNVISCDWFVAYKYYVTKVEALSCFWHPIGGLGRRMGGRIRQKGVKCWKGSQITNKVSNMELNGRKSWGLIVFSYSLFKIPFSIWDPFHSTFETLFVIWGPF